MVKFDGSENTVIISTSDYHIDVQQATVAPLSSMKNVQMTDFDKILLKKWEQHMEEGHFRYGLEVLETRNLFPDGKY